jgi:hypothetical protein
VLLAGFQKGGISRLVEEKGREQFWPICVVQGKTDRISLLLGSIKCFPISFNTFKTLDGSLMELVYQLKKKNFKGQVTPWEVKGHGALLKMLRLVFFMPILRCAKIC